MSFLIDKITNSIEEASTGRSFDTMVLAIDKAGLKDILKKMDGGSTGKKN